MQDEPIVTDLVGDPRKLRVIGVDPGDGKDVITMGIAWQDEAGGLHGSGYPALMLIYPEVAQAYQNAGRACEISPLTVLFTRLARSPFSIAEVDKE